MVNESRPRRLEIILINQDDNKKDKGAPLRYLESFSRIVSLVAIPVLIAAFGWNIQKGVTDRTVAKDYVQLAVSILNSTGKSKGAYAELDKQVPAAVACRHGRRSERPQKRSRRLARTDQGVRTYQSTKESCRDWRGGRKCGQPLAQRLLATTKMPHMPTIELGPYSSVCAFVVGTARTTIAPTHDAVRRSDVQCLWPYGAFQRAQNGAVAARRRIISDGRRTSNQSHIGIYRSASPRHTIRRRLYEYVV